MSNAMIATIAEMYSGRFVRSIVSSATKNQLPILQLSLCFQDSLIQLPNSGTMRSLTRLEVPGQPGLGQMEPDRVPSRFFRKLIEAASAPPCSSPPPSCSARPSPPASTCPGTSSCPIRAPRCTSASPSPASGPSCRPGRSLRLSSSA